MLYLVLKVSKERLDKLFTKAYERTVSSTILSGTDIELAVIDVVERTTMLIIAGYDKSWNPGTYNLMKTSIPANLLNKLLSLMNEMKCAYMRCRVIGSKILTVYQVEEFDDSKIPENIIMDGTVSRSQYGTVVFIDTESGRYLVNPHSNKGALLAVKGIDGDKILFVGIIRQRNNIPVINFIHWCKAEENILKQTNQDINQQQKAEISSEEVDEVMRELGQI